MASQTQPNPQHFNDQYRYTVNSYQQNIIGVYANTAVAQGARAYAATVATNPQLDESLCKTLGKVVHVCAKVPKGTRPTSLHLHTNKETEKEQPTGIWRKDIPENPSENVTEARTYTVFIPPERMDEKVKFRLSLASAAPILFPKNWTIDLKNYGLFTKIDLGDVDEII